MATTSRNLGLEDAPHETPVLPAEDARTVLINRVSWGAVLAGVAVALAVQAVLTLLGVGVGAASIEPTSTDNPDAQTISVAASLWWIIAGIISSAAGGYVAGRVAGQPKESTAGWHGLTSWAVTTLIVLFMITSTVGSLVGGALGTLSSVLGNVTQAAAQTAAPAIAASADPFSGIENEIRSAAPGSDPAAMRDAAVASIRALVTGDQAQADQARERAAAALAGAQGIPIEEARTRVQAYEQRYREMVEAAQQQADQAADAAADAMALGAIISAISLILGAIAAWFAGRAGAVYPTISTAVLDRRS